MPADDPHGPSAGVVRRRDKPQAPSDTCPPYCWPSMGHYSLMSHGRGFYFPLKGEKEKAFLSDSAQPRRGEGPFGQTPRRWAAEFGGGKANIASLKLGSLLDSLIISP